MFVINHSSVGYFSEQAVYIKKFLSYCIVYVSLHKQSMNHISLKKIGLDIIHGHPLCSDVFQPIPGFISCVACDDREMGNPIKFTLLEICKCNAFMATFMSNNQR